MLNSTGVYSRACYLLVENTGILFGVYKPHYRDVYCIVVRSMSGIISALGSHHLVSCVKWLPDASNPYEACFFDNRNLEFILRDKATCLVAQRTRFES
jgi:hypothetical protein